MEQFDNIKHKGVFEYELLDAATGEVLKRETVNNLLTNFARTRYLKLLAGHTSGLKIDDLKIRYMAFGDGTAAAAHSDTKLAHERYRQQITAKTRLSDRLRTMVSVSPYISASNFRIREIGVFCGSGATGAKDSGFLLARVNVDIEKTSNVVLNVTRYDIVTI